MTTADATYRGCPEAPGEFPQYGVGLDARLDRTIWSIRAQSTLAHLTTSASRH